MNDLQELINESDLVKRGQALLNPVVEVLDYESISGKVCTEADTLLTTPEIKISYLLDFWEPDENKLAVVQDRGRQSINYQEDTALINMLRKPAVRHKNIKDAFMFIRSEIESKGLRCEAIYIPTDLIQTVKDECGDEVDWVGQYELIAAGYIGTYLNVVLLTTARTMSFEYLAPNEMFGIDFSKCKREVLSSYCCVKKPRGSSHDYTWEATIQLALLDKNAVVWAEL
jgi:hypothetical protein